MSGPSPIKLAPNATTTITGTLADTNKVAARGARLPGSTLRGENPGGINIPKGYVFQPDGTAVK